MREQVQQQQPKPATPFFARYLEQQEVVSVRTDVKAGKPDQTMKAPSDRDEI
jgi:hypothetical protein